MLSKSSDTLRRIMNKPINNSGSVNLIQSKLDGDDDEPVMDREHRVRALRSMLAATEARQGGKKRARNQTLAAGLKVLIRNGAQTGQEGVILDADYIHSKVLVDLFDGTGDVWVKFSEVSPLPTPE